MDSGHSCKQDLQLVLREYTGGHCHWSRSRRPHDYKDSRSLSRTSHIKATAALCRFRAALARYRAYEIKVVLYEIKLVFNITSTGPLENMSGPWKQC